MRIIELEVYKDNQIRNIKLCPVHISHMEDGILKDECILHMSDGSEVRVQESLDMVVNKIRNAIEI